MDAAASHVVLRPFESGGQRLVTGQVVETAGWRNADKLVANRYLRPATDADLMRAAEPAPVNGSADGAGQRERKEK